MRHVLAGGHDWYMHAGFSARLDFMLLPLGCVEPESLGIL